MRRVRRFMQDDAATVSIEYAILIACISVGIIAACYGLGTGISAMLDGITNQLAGGP